MKFQSRLLFGLIVFFCTCSWGRTDLVLQRLCVAQSCFDYTFGKPVPVSQTEKIAKYILSVDLTDEQCRSKNNCYLYLGAVADSAKVEVNGHTIVDNTIDQHSFSYQDSIRIPISSELLGNSNELVIFVKDSNGTLWGLLSRNVFIGTEFETYKAQIFDWFVRTGVTLFSAYTLVIFAITILLILCIRFDTSILSVFIYCIVACIYLASFSEYPRKFFAPEVFSGTVHFALRLLQDVCLFTVFHLILNVQKRYVGFYLSLVLLYAGFILSFPGAYLMGFKSYEIAKTIIYIGAPLVALPMGYGFFLARRLPMGLERSILVPTTFFLFALQIHDLLLFWQLINSYFMVKFYIPLVVSLILYIQIRRYAEDYSDKNRTSEKVVMAKQVIHDIKSPVGVLGVVIAKANIDAEMKELADMAFERMFRLAKNLEFESVSPNEIHSVSISDTIKKIVREKKIEYSDENLQIQFDCPDNIRVLANEFDLVRILSNILNNSVEASDESPEINITVTPMRKCCEVNIIDRGRGIPAEALTSVGEFGFSFGKKNGTKSSGLGLYSAKKAMRAWGGDIRISSELGRGTTVSLIFPT